MASSRKFKEIAFRGGYFGFIHNGHLLTTEVIRDELGIDLVYFVTGAEPPHRENGIPAETRHRLVEVAVADNPYFKASRIELEREGPSYTLETIRELRRMHGKGVRISMIVGSEYLDPNEKWNLSKWFGAEQIFKNVRIIVSPADPNHTVELLNEWAKLIPGADIVVVDVPYIGIRGTQIRERIQNGQSIRYMVPDAVAQIIEDERLLRPKRRRNKRTN